MDKGTIGANINLWKAIAQQVISEMGIPASTSLLPKIVGVLLHTALCEPQRGPCFILYARQCAWWYIIHLQDPC